jgi:hypothetical protein
VLPLGTLKGDATVSLMMGCLGFRKVDQKRTLFAKSVEITE